jgi:hypothetical protein
MLTRRHGVHPLQVRIIDFRKKLLPPKEAQSVV